MAQSEAVHVDGAKVDASGDSFAAGVGPCASADRPNRTSRASIPEAKGSSRLGLLSAHDAAAGEDGFREVRDKHQSIFIFYFLVSRQ
jgi:hypothetical protein